MKRFLRMENFTEHLELHRLDCLSSTGNLDSYEHVLARLEGRVRNKEEALALVRTHFGDCQS